MDGLAVNNDKLYFWINNRTHYSGAFEHLLPKTKSIYLVSFCDTPQ